jgi:Txe/YoeB family toxin of Txe-Axe toxin-antitoxin module
VKVRLNFTPRAAKDLQELARDAGQRKRLRSVRKALALLETNQRHPSLHTHKYESLKARAVKMFSRPMWKTGPLLLTGFSGSMVLVTMKSPSLRLLLIPSRGEAAQPVEQL